MKIEETREWLATASNEREAEWLTEMGWHFRYLTLRPNEAPSLRQFYTTDAKLAERTQRDEYHDLRGIGRFCNSLWEDKEGPYCSTLAFEGRSVCHCPHSERSCHVVSFVVGEERRMKIQCGGEKTGEPTLVGVCQDFEPALWLRKKLGVP